MARLMITTPGERNPLAKVSRLNLKVSHYPQIHKTFRCPTHRKLDRGDYGLVQRS